MWQSALAAPSAWPRPAAEASAPARAMLPRVSDAELVERCRAGDPAAFQELFRVHRGDVARLVHRMTAGRDVDDLVQEVFLQAHRSLPRFRGDSRLGTWLYRITMNVVLMHRRAARARPELVAEIRGPAPRDDAGAPDEQVARGRRIAAFHRLLGALSDKKRAVFVLHELEGLPPAEIATVLGIPVLTVRTRLFYARRELLAALAEEPALEEAAAVVGLTGGRASGPGGGRA